MPNTSFPPSPCPHSAWLQTSNKLWQRAEGRQTDGQREMDRHVAYVALTGKTIKTKVETIKMSDPVTHM